MEEATARREICDGKRTTKVSSRETATGEVGEVEAHLRAFETDSRKTMDPNELVHLKKRRRDVSDLRSSSTTTKKTARLTKLTANRSLLFTGLPPSTLLANENPSSLLRSIFPTTTKQSSPFRRRICSMLRASLARMARKMARAASRTWWKRGKWLLAVSFEARRVGNERKGGLRTELTMSPSPAPASLITL